MEIPHGLRIDEMCEHFTNFLRSIGYQNKNIIEQENEEEN
jgi:hypothetical protein